MQNKIFYEITQDSTGTPVAFTGARYVTDNDKENIREVLAMDYRVPIHAVIITDVRPFNGFSE